MIDSDEDLSSENSEPETKKRASVEVDRKAPILADENPDNVAEEEILINLGLNPEKVRLDDLSETDLQDIENKLLLEDDQDLMFDLDLEVEKREEHREDSCASLN